MKWYDAFECDNTVENPLIVGKADLKGFDEWDFMEGRPIQNWDKKVWFQVRIPENEGDPDDVLQDHLGLPIFSSRLRKALDKAEIAGIQYLPVRILHYDGTPIQGFAIVNILNLVPALDLARSDFDLFGEDRPDRKGEIVGLRESVLRKSALEGYDIIRLKEYKLAIFVSERFKKVFEAGGFTGYSFHECELS